MTINLYKHQTDVLEQTKEKNRVAYYLDMGLGKTFVGSEKAKELGKHILVVCQKSKVDDWYKHFDELYDCHLYDLTRKKDFDKYCDDIKTPKWKDTTTLMVAVINYDLIFRRKELSQLIDYTLMLDESSLIQNETSKRASFILRKLFPSNVILLSGTPTSGKYEKLWSQCRLLGWRITKTDFYRRYVVEEDLCNWAGLKILTPYGSPIKKVVGYKNVKELKENLRYYGAVFMKTDEVLELPEQNFVEIDVDESTAYRKFKRDKIIDVGNNILVGDTSLTELLYSRQLCGHYNKKKLDTFKDLVNSTDDRLIVFYNFNDELAELQRLVDKPISTFNGASKDLTAYETYDNSVTFIQYQSGSMGINLQLANKIIYFTPPLSSELFEQSKKRIHRIGQSKKCFYYKLTCGVEKNIYNALDKKRDYTDALFQEEKHLRKIL